jgi:peptidyl-prolyl cis-trans isomerase SurA
MRLRGFVWLSCAIAVGYGADVLVMEEIVAKVNGDIVTRSELERSRAQLKEELERRGAKGADLTRAVQEREKDILRDRIDQLLVIQKGKELNLSVDAEVSKQIAEAQKATGVADPDKFAAIVKEQTGMALEDYKQEMKNTFLFQRVIRQEVGGKINIPRAELRKYYDEHNKEFMREDRIFLRELFISTEGKDPAGLAAAEKKAKDLIARARKGERFAELARDNSDNPATAANGGLLEPAKREDLRKEIADAVWNQPRGTITEPISLGNGFLILRVEEQHKAGLAAFEEVENEITEKLYMKVFDPKIREYLTQLRSEAFLEIKPGYEDSSPASGKNTTWSDPLQLRPETVTKEEVALEPPRRRRLLWMVPMPGTQTESVSRSK